MQKFAQIWKAALTKLAMLATPVSGIIAAVKAVWDLIQFVRENMSSISGLVSAVTNTLAAAAVGDSGTVAAGVEAALCRLIPLAIDLLLRLAGINVGGAIQNVVGKIRGKVQGVIDKIIGKLKGIIDKSPIGLAVDKAKKTAATVEGKIEDGKTAIKSGIESAVDKGIDKVNGVVDPHLDKAVNTFNNSKAGQRVAAANNRAQGIADGLTGFTKSADAKTAGMRNTLGKATDTLNEFNSASKYGDAFGLDAGKISDGIKGVGSKPAEKETTKEPEGKGEARESEKKAEGSGDIAKDLIKTAEKVAEVKGGETESAVAEEKPLSRGEELRQKYGHLSPEDRKALLAQKLEENRERRKKEGQEQERAEQIISKEEESSYKLYTSEMVDKAISQISDKNLEHIVNGSTSLDRDHKWNLISEQKTRDEIVVAIRYTLINGTIEPYYSQNVYNATSVYQEHTVEVTFIHIEGGIMRISNAWVKN